MFEKSETRLRLHNCWRASGRQQRLSQRVPGRTIHFCAAYLFAQITPRPTWPTDTILSLSRSPVEQSSALEARCRRTSRISAWAIKLTSPSGSRARKVRVSSCRTNSRSAATFPFGTSPAIFHGGWVLTLSLPILSRQTGWTLVWKMAMWSSTSTTKCGNQTNSITMTCGIMWPWPRRPEGRENFCGHERLRHSRKKVLNRNTNVGPTTNK